MIEFGEHINEAELSIYNSIGQKIKTISNISGTMFQLDREELADGIYTISLIQGKKIIGVEQVVIAN